MLNEKTGRKGIIFGFLGGVLGLIVAIILFFVSFIFLFGWWGKPQFFPIQILEIGLIVSFLILLLAIILKLRRVGIITSAVIFLMSYIETIRISRMSKLPINANKAPIFCLVVLLAPLLIWLMFIMAAVKKSSRCKQSDKQKCV